MASVPESTLTLGESMKYGWVKKAAHTSLESDDGVCCAIETCRAGGNFMSKHRKSNSSTMAIMHANVRRESLRVSPVKADQDYTSSMVDGLS